MSKDYYESEKDARSRVNKNVEEYNKLAKGYNRQSVARSRLWMLIIILILLAVLSIIGAITIAASLLS